MALASFQAYRDAVHPANAYVFPEELEARLSALERGQVLNMF